MDEQRERELKFDAPHGWSLPKLDRLVPAGGRIEVETLRLQTTYYDTAGCDLLARGVTLRRRAGDADAGWQLKVPDGDARTEFRVPYGSGSGVPAELRELVVAVRAGSPLRRAAVLETTRTVHRVRTAADVLLEIADDSVRATTCGQASVLSEWREVEIELVDGSERDLSSAARRLEKSGLIAAGRTSKLARALNYTRAGAPQADPGSLVELVQRYFIAQYDVLTVGDIGLRRGRDVVHSVRVATRRLRSVLRAFRALFDAERASRLEDELRWYAGLLGAVRDRQVLRGHLATSADEFGASIVLDTAMARVAAVLDDEQEQAFAALRRAISGRRYLTMVRELRAWCEVPPLADPPQAAVVAEFVRAAERRQRKRLKQWSRRPDDLVAMHDARKAAKRLRYAAELATPAVDGVRKAQKRATDVQQQLGIAQDGVAASEFLRRASVDADGDTGFALGALWSAEQGRLAAVRCRALRNLS